MGIEAERHLEFHCPLGPDVLLIQHLHGTERLGECFEYVLTLYSKDTDIKAEDLLGQHATVRVKVGAHPERFFDGIVCEFGAIGYQKSYALYRTVLRPWFWLLSRTSECRVFQKKTTSEIFDAIVKEKWGFTKVDRKLLYALQPREYCVQYRESDLSFLMRLMEEDGIYYFFKHELGNHTMMLADSISAHDSVSGFEDIHFRRVEEVDFEKPQGAMLTWMSNNRVQPGRVALRDYDFEKPMANLDALCDDPKPHQHADGEVFDWPGHYVQAPVGQDRARVRLEELQAAYALGEGSTDASGLYAGALFNLKDHPRQSENREYLIVSATYETDSGTFESGASTVRFVMQMLTLDSKIPFRPMRRTPAPIIPGAQTATVVGPKDSEIWTEKYGRVKVQFHWDRYGTRDENSSCWVRVAQVWAGSNWGAIFIPRIGQEVVVEFLDGNPDKPLITGSVYNDRHKPPYELSKNQTQSGFKTQSSKGGGKADYNELRFEDKKGAEEITLNAQKDLSITVEHDETKKVQNNISINVADGFYATVVEKGFKSTEVPENKYDLSAKQIFELAKEIIQLTVGPCEIVIDQQQIKLTAFANTITLNAAGVSISAGGGTVDVNPAGVSAAGPMVKLNS